MVTERIYINGKLTDTVEWYDMEDFYRRNPPDEWEEKDCGFWPPGTTFEDHPGSGWWSAKYTDGCGDRVELMFIPGPSRKRR